MHGWIYRRHGGPEVLDWTPLEARAPGEGEISVRVVAAALNPLDWKLRAGQFRLMSKSPPRGTGYDYAGTVEAVGAGVADFVPGDAVVGLVHPMNSREGTMAERLVAPAALAVRKPPRSEEHTSELQ